jgi:GT2 family glycosyltransferase/glycosyltransferase involved in cell wall biosynthesis
VNERVTDLEERVQVLEYVNERNEGQLREIVSRLDLLRKTHAWRIMLIARRARVEFLRGTTKERIGFLKWMLHWRARQVGMDEYDPFPRVSIEPVPRVKTASCAVQETGNEDETSHRVQESGSILYPVGFDIFRFSVIEWDFRWQRPQQISSEFARHGHRVFYVSIDTIGLSDSNLQYADIQSEVRIRLLRENVWSIKLCSSTPLNAYRSTISDEVDRRYLEWSIRAVREHFGCGMTVSIVDIPFWSPLAMSMGETNRVVYDCMDDHSGFSTNSRDMLEAARGLEEQADLVIASSATLFSKVSARNGNTLLLRNACEYDHFAVKPLDKPEMIDGIAGPVIGYYGAISEWFDVDLVYDLARQSPFWTFVLIGNTFGCDTAALRTLPNVVLTGEVAYESLPAYLHRFDACMIPFKVYNLTLATNPVKIYEYMSAGKPVISTRLPEVELMSEYVYIADNASGFKAKIECALSEDKEKMGPPRKEFARSNTWRSRYETLVETLTTLFYPKISVVVVTFGSWRMTRNCLQSLITKTAYPNLEIIVVDNGSGSEMREGLAAIRDHRLRVILLPCNMGFANGNAEGCRVSTGEYVILLNNDTLVPLNWTYRLIRAFLLRPSLGLVGPVSNSVGNDQMLDYSCTNVLTGAEEGWLEEFYELYDGRIRVTDYLGFFCVAIRRDVYNVVGDMDPNYGIGMFEDDDYCQRVRAAGYELGVVEDAFVYHYGSASFKNMDAEERDQIWLRNRNYFESKWGQTWVSPRPPSSLFHNALDSSSIAAGFKLAKRPAILVSGPLSWERPWSSWQELAVSLSKDYLVIVILSSHLGRPFQGTRKLGPQLYITNVIELFESVTFNCAIYCGGFTSGVRARSVFVIPGAYDHTSLQLLRDSFKQRREVDTVSEIGECLRGEGENPR